MDFRLESDSIGTKEVPKEAYYGVQSLRGAENFNITGLKLNRDFIISLAEIKKAAAIANGKAGILNLEIQSAIIKASEDIINGKLHDEFIIDPIQGGAGTSANMNANEVIANRAIEILHGNKGDYSIVHPNDHVNMGQSTNDVIPTAGKITLLKLLPKAIVKLSDLAKVLKTKAAEFNDIIKMGRTQLQDAVPIRLGQEFNAYCSVIKRDILRLEKIQEELRVINIGGTAIGTCLNADEQYLKNIIPALNSITNLNLKKADDLIDATQNLDCFVAVSSAIKTCAVNLSKISNDLRLMSSGPRTGLGEINLPARQNGSSIMPGKVNPVIPEVMNQICFNIIGNDMTITMAAEAGQFELNAFEPIIFYKLFESIETLTRGVDSFIDNCVSGITANKNRCQELVDNSVGVVTAICPYIGYKKAAQIAKAAIKSGKSVRKIVLDEGILKESEIKELLDPLSMTEPKKKIKHLINQ